MAVEASVNGAAVPYEQGTPHERRLLNQGFFTRITCTKTASWRVQNSRSRSCT